jgi:formate C-acetyltransferase
LPQHFKNFCADYSIKYSSIQYENDDLMRTYRGDDYGIACCVSAMKLGKEMQFFGARANVAKTLLYAINNGYDEIHPIELIPNSDKKKINKLGPNFGQLDINKPLVYEEVVERFKKYLS